MLAIYNYFVAFLTAVSSSCSHYWYWWKVDSEEHALSEQSW